MELLEIHVGFEGLNPLEASQATTDLAAFLAGCCAEAKATPRRADPDAQDMGSTLVLLFGTPALVVLAQGIKSWLAQRDKGELRFTTGNGEIVAKGLSSRATRDAFQSALEAAIPAGNRSESEG